MKSLLAVILVAIGSSAWGECACFCANGALTTMCTTVIEAQDNPTLCTAYSGEICPAAIQQGEAASYESPEEGAVDCRNMRVWDSVEGAYADIRVCDVLDS